jgi:hypothetical protein
MWVIVVGVVLVSSSLFLLWKRGKNAMKPSDRYRKDDKKYELCELKKKKIWKMKHF